ncbi:DEDD exonuclease domain-containing protein [Lolliginicoccus suaedae]|uniref:DEDD exonuclease domain-containing protein n=1 Tax=Lolliginicoccus suaedae TaxID=2605429 RepID=UPI002E27092A
MPTPRPLPAGQMSLPELEETLRDTTFVIVDLETTGGSPENDSITEIGAVKVRGGARIGEFATLVNPQRDIPPYIIELTGITTAMVREAPPINEVLPAFLEFARGSILVAHNARFDTGFLRAAATRLSFDWPFPRTLCTVVLARRILDRGEAPSAKLSALAAHFNVPNSPTHRALDDARATVDVFHALLERVGNQGVHTLNELEEYYPRVPSTVRAKRTLADDLPDGPGVYIFRGPSDEPLYIGTSSNLRKRVRSYFTGSEKRTAMREMIALATRVDHVPCSHTIEAGVRELRLLAATSPPYNRRSTSPRRAWWISLTDEAFPRLAVARTARGPAIGPLSSRASAQEAAEVLATGLGLRTCRARLGANATHPADCGTTSASPCAASRHGSLSADEYAAITDQARATIAGHDNTVLDELRAQLEHLAAAEKFETAARLRDRTATLGLALHRSQRLASLIRIDELVVGRPDGHRGWELVVIRRGRLAAAGVARQGTSPLLIAEHLRAAAETTLPSEQPLEGTHPEEIALLLSWLDTPGTRIVTTSHGFHQPARGAAQHADWCQQARTGARRDQLLRPDRRTDTLT